MADVRRSGRATKGQHNKTRDEDEEATQKGKSAQKKGGKREAEPEEETEIIRCVCGQYEEEEDEPRTMICCDSCSSWQHNDCMLLPDDYAPPKYFCEQCKPANHKKLLDLMKKGEKPWEEVARQREAAQAEKNARKKGKKGRKSGNGRLSEAVRTPTVEPDEQSSARKRKLEESPAPDTSNKRSRSAARGGKNDIPLKESKDEDESEFGAVAHDVKAIVDPSRKRTATALVKSFVEQAETAIQNGSIEEPEELSAQNLGTRIALHVEHAIYHVRSNGAGEPNQAYKDQLRAILNNIKTNPDLLVRLVNNDLSSEDFARMDPKDMATNEQKQKDADTKIALEKQHTIVEEDQPRIRKTHKGDEYVVDPPQAPQEPASKATMLQENSMAQDEEIKSPIQPSTSEKPQSMRKPSAAGKGRPFGDPRRKSSNNFDIDKIYSTVQGSPPISGDGQKFDGIQNTPGTSGATVATDAEIDNLLKDEEAESEPYSPKEYIEDDVIWKGRVAGGNIGTFEAIAKFAAGCKPDVENLRMSWSQVLPSEIKLFGRIDPAKADDYLCGLEYSNTTELIIVNIPEPKDATAAAQFDKFFTYLKDKGRYGVMQQSTNPAIKDIYLMPMAIGQQLPTVMKALNHEFPDPVQERSFLLPIVIKWTELPQNADRVRLQQEAAAMSPSLGPPIAQTPITPREPQSATFAQHPLPVQLPPSTKTNGHIASPSPRPTSQQTQAVSAPAKPAPPPQVQHSGQAPAAVIAERVLGPESARLPAIVSLIKQAPNAGEQEFYVIKDCLTANAEAGRNIGVLAQMLQAYHAKNAENKKQAQAQAQAQQAVTSTNP